MRQFIFLAVLVLAAAPIPAPVANLGLPEPPQQRKPWTPPRTAVPETFITAAGKLFEQGLADPRGCEYRTIRVETENRWLGAMAPAKTHGWLVPTTAGMTRQYAICWDGLIYPISELGPAVDLAADVKMGAEMAKRSAAGFNAELNRHGAKEAMPIWQGRPDAMSVLLLLRLGEGDLATQLHDGAQDGDPYPGVARQWAERVYQRGVGAHLRRDDRLALAYLSLVSSAAPGIEAEAVQRGWRPEAGRKPFFDSLGRLRYLLADQERRNAARPRPPIVCFGPGRDPDAKVRIAGLVERMDEIDNAYGTNVGTGSMGYPGVADALFLEGEAAIEPLLKCLEGDSRMTRSAPGRDDWESHGAVISVAETAKSVLVRHLNGLDFAIPEGDALFSLDEAARKELAARINERLKKPDAKLPPIERWFSRLADDAAAIVWAEAAEMLTAWENYHFISTQRPLSPDFVGPRELWKPPLKGEFLRQRMNPSVTELMAKRTRQAEDGWTAARLALALAKWDRAAADPKLLAFVMRRSDTQGDHSKFLEVLTVRIETGDPAALDDYAAWVRTLKPESLHSHFGDDPFRLMWEHRDHVEVRKAAEWMFTDPASPWVPIQRPKGNGRDAYYTLRLLPSSLIRVGAFRSAVLAMLADKSEVGTIKTGTDGGHSIAYDDGFTFGGMYTGRAPGYPARYVGRFRACDYAAATIGAEDDSAAPLCYLYWPEAKRDAAVAACVEFVKRYGARMDFNGKPTFPLHGQPATADDVRRAEAIFSLTDEGPVRAVPMTYLPWDARWVTLKDTAYITQQPDATGKYVPSTVYAQNGRVWQVEEVFKNGRWQRYYGFAGGHRIACVPAEEIEFFSYGCDIGNGFELRTDPQWGTAQFNVGGPVPLVLHLRNRRGVPAPTPDLNQTTPVRTWYSPDVVSLQGNRVPRARRHEDWEEMTPRLGARPESSRGRTLEAGAEVRLEPIDLAQLFYLGRPGFYRVRLAAIKDPASDQFSFYVAPALKP